MKTIQLICTVIAGGALFSACERTTVVKDDGGPAKVEKSETHVHMDKPAETKSETTVNVNKPAESTTEKTTTTTTQP
jgi:hypothetical protein